MAYGECLGIQSVRASGLLLSNHHFGSQAVRSMKKSLALSTLVLCLTAGFVPTALAQKSAKAGRKIVSDVKPVYPPTLKNMHIEGLVRLTAIVLPTGSVVAVKVKGGTPILVENAVKAVKVWRYAPGPNQTEEEVVLNFGAKEFLFSCFASLLPRSSQ